MKKAVVLVLAVLALAGFASMALAAQDVFVSTWIHPMSMWMGSAQATYGTTPSNHAINTQSGPPYTDAVVVDPDNGANYVAQILYSKNKETWSGRIVQVDGSATDTLNLSGSSALNFNIRRGSTMTADVTVSKIAMFNSGGVEIAYPTSITATSTWQTLSIPLTGSNLGAVNKLFEIIMTDTQNAANGNTIEVLLDNIRYTDNSSGTVTVTLTTGVVGVTVAQSINFDLLGSSVVIPNAALNSASISDGSQNHFVVTNIGNSAAAFSLNLVNPAAWTANTPTLNLNDSGLRLATDIFALYGIFTDGTAPVLADYKDTAITADSDVITTTPQEATAGSASAAVFGGVTAANGYNVAAGAARNLWIGLKLPNQISASASVTILVVVSAAAL